MMDLKKLFLRRPCANCPFNKVRAIELNPGRVEGIIDDMVEHDDRPFLCHKMLDQDTRSYCTGAVTYLLKVRQPNIAMRLGASLKMFDPDQMLSECGQAVIDPPVENKTFD
jgi:hypothetical protein